MAENLREQMDKALEGALTPEQQAEFEDYLARNPNEATLWAKVVEVDRLLKDEPLIPAPQGFAERVMLRLDEDTAPEQLAPDRKIAIGLSLTAATLIPIMIGLLSFSVESIQGSLAESAHQTVLWLMRVLGLLESVAMTISGLLTRYPALSLLPIFTLLLTAAWFWLVRTLTPGKPDRHARVIIPVRAG